MWSLSFWSLDGTRSRWSSCAALLALEPGTQDLRLLPSWMAVEQESHVRQELLIVDPRHPKFIKMNLSASSFLGAPLSMSHHQIFGVGSEETQIDEINLRWTRDTKFRLIRVLRRVIVLRLVWFCWYWFADCFCYSFRYVFSFFFYWWGSNLSIYNRGTVS
jgi:hypothetical protein